jgi:hypothetical protein
MFIYLFLYVLALIQGFWEKGKTLFIVLAVGMILVSGFRDMIGGFDVYIYGEVYEVDTVRMFLYPNFEWGFKVYYWVLKLISDKREFLFFVTALLMVIMHSSLIKKLSPLFGLSVFIYFCKFFLMSFVYFRQGLAMGIIWFAIPFLLDRKYGKAFIMVALAYFFHKSSMVFLPFLLIANYRFTAFQLISLTFLLSVVVISPLGAYFTELIASSSGNEKLARYAQDVSGINLFYVLEVLLFGVLAVIFKPIMYGSEYKNAVLFYNGFVVYVWVILFALTNATFVRLAWYFFIFVPLALPTALYVLKDINLKRFFKVTLIVYYSAIFFRLLLVYDGGDFMPYKSIFQDFDRNGRWEFMEYRHRLISE